jgi:hypothetical protein
MIDIEEISFNYTSAGVRSFSYSPQTISIKIPTTDITLKEYYRAFKSFLRAIGFSTLENTRQLPNGSTDPDFVDVGFLS